MDTKTFFFDMRGFKKNAGVVDTAIAAWIAAVSPASLDDMTTSISDDSLIVIIRFTA